MRQREKGDAPAGKMNNGVVHDGGPSSRWMDDRLIPRQVTSLMNNAYFNPFLPILNLLCPVVNRNIHTHSCLLCHQGKGQGEQERMVL